MSQTVSFVWCTCKLLCFGGVFILFFIFKYAILFEIVFFLIFLSICYWCNMNTHNEIKIKKKSIVHIKQTENWTWTWQSVHIFFYRSSCVRPFLLFRCYFHRWHTSCYMCCFLYSQTVPPLVVTYWKLKALQKTAGSPRECISSTTTRVTMMSPLSLSVSVCLSVSLSLCWN